MDQTKPRLIHLACILSSGDPNPRYLLLKQLDQQSFGWFEKTVAEEVAQPITAITIGKAILKARQHWKNDSFRTVNCGFRYTLPERDEHGMNALYYQMVASYSSSNGIYFDEEAGYNCFVNFASQEALSLWSQITANKPLLRFPPLPL